jgi:ParB-like chromosome segregation protein Spo0J
MKITELKRDPHNARKHNPRNLDTIATSIKEVGTGRSIVIDEDNVVLAGNGTVEAAPLAGVKDVRVIDVDGDELVAIRRRGLTPAQKTRLALADNRANELSEWDADVMAQLKEQTDALDGLFTDKEFARLLPKTSGDADAIVPRFDLTYSVIVTARDEAHQLELITRLQAEGLSVKAMIN